MIIKIMPDSSTANYGSVSKNNTNKSAQEVNFNNDLTNLDGYKIDSSSNKVRMNIDGDYTDIGSIELKVDQNFEWTDDIIQKYKQQIELDKKYGFYGVSVQYYSREETYAEFGRFAYVDIDKFVYSAQAKADGLSEDKCAQLFSLENLATKISLFADKKYYTQIQDIYTGVIDEDIVNYKNEKSDTIQNIKNQLTDIFNELADNIKNGHGDSIQALQSKLDVGGYSVTLGELMDIRDVFDNATYIAGGERGTFLGSASEDIYGAGLNGIANAYARAYANERLSGDAAKWVNDIIDKNIADSIAEIDEKFSNFIHSPKPGTEYSSPYTIFTGTFREEAFNIFNSLDTSSEQALLKGIPAAVAKAVSLEYSVIMQRGGWHDFAQGCADSANKYIQEAVSRIRSFDTVRTTK